MYGSRVKYVLKRDFSQRKGSEVVDARVLLSARSLQYARQKRSLLLCPGSSQDPTLTLARTAGRSLTPTPGSPRGHQSRAGLGQIQAPSSTDTGVNSHEQGGRMSDQIPYFRGG